MSQTRFYNATTAEQQSNTNNIASIPKNNIMYKSSQTFQMISKEISSATNKLKNSQTSFKTFEAPTFLVNSFKYDDM